MMAVTSIWRISGSGSLAKLIKYAENPEKTELATVIEYAVNSDKTQLADDESEEIVKSFVSGINCNPSTAVLEMAAVKKHFGKENGVIAYHGYQSFRKDEVTPEVAHEIGIKLAKKLWGESYQVLVATHLDKAEHLHNHFVLNTVSFLDGKKYHRTEKDYFYMQKESDNLCREYGLSVVEEKQGKGKDYGEWRAEKENRPTWRGIIKSDIDEAIAKSMTETQFFNELRKMGYELKFGKDISVRPEGKERFLRLKRNFGEDYSLENIRKRILEHRTPQRTVLEIPKAKKTVLKGNFKTVKKATGFRALYFHYCYLLGYFPNKKPKSNKRLHFLLREDLIKMEQISSEARLLGKYHIDTIEQLFSYKSQIIERIAVLTEERKLLYRKKSDDTEKSKIPDITKEIAVLRKELELCEGIEKRSVLIKEKLHTVREVQRKEIDKNDKFR